MDVRLYSSTGKYVDISSSSELTNSALADALVASGIEVLGNKVVKFLLTQKGSDALDPNYGGVALHYGQISKAFIPRLTLEMQNDILRCREYLRKAESGLSKSTEKISNIVLQDIKYDELASPDRVDVYIEIITTKNNRALVALQSR